ncbi:MAG: DUF389 domain-containing protein [Alphaproteobacteria bacterium]|nr:DUF389 domain-containing protein [Alphaproteobacteria bacterium]
MPRTVEISVPPSRRVELLDRLETLDGVAAILVHEQASHLPPGDLVVLRGTNQAAEQVVRIAADMRLIESGGALAINEPLGLASGERRRKIESDSSDSTWEEIDTLLRRDTNPSLNFLGMMALAGAVAGAGLMQDILHIVIGAMLIAPGFEPLVRISHGVACGLRDSALRGLISAGLAYLVLALGAILGMFVAIWLDPTLALADLPSREWVQFWTNIKLGSVAIALFAGLAGALVVNSHQTVFATGVMIALALVPGMAIFGMGLAAGMPSLALLGVGRWAVDAACVLIASALVFGLKRVLRGREAQR